MTDAEIREIARVLLRAATGEKYPEEWLNRAFDQQVANIRMKRPVDVDWLHKAEREFVSAKFEQLRDYHANAFDACVGEWAERAKAFVNVDAA